jgi:hypothetical protein
MGENKTPAAGGAVAVGDRGPDRHPAAGHRGRGEPGGRGRDVDHPLRTQEDHRPIGEIQRVREEVYRRSSIGRHRINHQPRVQPESSAQLLG